MIIEKKKIEKMSSGGVRIFGSYISNGNANNRTVYEDEKSYFYFNISFKKFCNISIRNINAL